MTVLMQKTYVAKPNELPQKWFHVDASEQILGRLAGDIAMILMGKHRPTYTPHVDTGDFVVVTNADKIVMTGKKWNTAITLGTTDTLVKRWKATRLALNASPKS